MSTPTTTDLKRVNQISQSVAAHLKSLIKTSPVSPSPEVILAALIDLTAAGLAALNVGDDALQESLANVAQEALKDRIQYYQLLKRAGLASDGTPIAH